MFGLFRKKSDKQAEEKKQFALDASYELLMTQFDLGSASTDPAAMQRVLTDFAMGYIFGFADAQVQKSGTTDDVGCMAAIAIIFTRLFDVDQGSRLVGKCFRIQSAPDFMEGRKLGAREVFRWFSEKDFTPLGLTDYLNTRTQQG